MPINFRFANTTPTQPGIQLGASKKIPPAYTADSSIKTSDIEGRNPQTGGSELPIKL
jgi:hypothetical protein